MVSMCLKELWKPFVHVRACVCQEYIVRISKVYIYTHTHTHTFMVSTKLCGGCDTKNKKDIVAHDHWVSYGER